MDATLKQQVERWISEDPDTTTRAELKALLDRGDEKDLADRFAGRLEFGTAGLRGVIGGGPNRMNRAVVRGTTAGLAAYLVEQVKGAKQRGVVVGFDGRRMSRELAEETASVLTAQGFTVYLYDHVCPTPLTAFAVLDKQAAAGVMVTASHNPPEYNGYKVYWENGAQIIPPHDKGISAKIEAVGPLTGVKLLPLADAKKAGLLHALGDDMERRYLTAIARLAVHPEVKKDLAIAYTPLHGVGSKLANAALANAGFAKVFTVAEQREPDGAFPTVRFPNPEEKGAMDLVIALAKKHDAPLVLANDPDADRLAVAVKTPSGGYQQLSGDQVGALLAYYLLTEKKSSGARLTCTTIVSSALLGEMSRALGASYGETLTGFKWIANYALTKPDLEFVMGYEEALGYTLGTVVRDKDGISAAMVFAELAAFCAARGQSVLGYLEEIYRRFGLFRSYQHSATLPGSSGLAQIKKIMADLRGKTVTSLGEFKVVATRDLSRGVRVKDGKEEQLDLPKSDVLVYELAGGGRITVRPSGTEPKIKCYFELREAVGASEPFDTAVARADQHMEALRKAFLPVAGIP